MDPLEVELEFRLKIHEYPDVAYTRPPGTGKAGYAGHNRQPTDVFVEFYQGKKIEEDIRDRILKRFKPERKRITKQFQKAIKSTKPDKIKIETDLCGKYIQINEKWLDDWVSEIKLYLKKQIMLSAVKKIKVLVVK